MFTRKHYEWLANFAGYHLGPSIRAAARAKPVHAPTVTATPPYRDHHKDAALLFEQQQADKDRRVIADIELAAALRQTRRN